MKAGSIPAASKQLACILAAAGPSRQLARVRWPMHDALRELDGELRRSGLSDLLLAPLDLRPSPDGGLADHRADRALDHLVHVGVLRAEGAGRSAEFVLDAEAAILARRDLMALPPRLVAAYRRAGTRWAALASTAAKNRSTAARSPASTVASSTPNRANPPAAEIA